MLFILGVNLALHAGDEHYSLRKLGARFQSKLNFKKYQKAAIVVVYRKCCPYKYKKFPRWQHPTRFYFKPGRIQNSLKGGCILIFCKIFKPNRMRWKIRVLAWEEKEKFFPFQLAERLDSFIPSSKCSGGFIYKFMAPAPRLNLFLIFMQFSGNLVDARHRPRSFISFIMHFSGKLAKIIGLHPPLSFPVWEILDPLLAIFEKSLDNNQRNA